MTFTPWWEAVSLRDEVASRAGQIDDVQMSLFNATKGTVPYSDAAYYGDITHPTPDLVDLLAKIAVRLGVAGAGSEQAKAVWRLHQGMGGGKSHGLVGMWHLAAHTAEFAATEIGEKALKGAGTLAGTWQVAPDLQRPLCVVLSCDNMTPGTGDVSVDGPAVTLGERCLWRLVERDGGRYEQYRELVNSTNKTKLQEAIESSGRPVLILIDEIMDYLRVAAATDRGLLEMDMAFLRSLLDCANEAKNCVVVMVMMESQHDNMELNSAGQKAREELNDLLFRNGRTAAVTGGADFADIIRRRLFSNEPTSELINETTDEFLAAMSGRWVADVFHKFKWAASDKFKREVERCFPFHPSLIDLAEHEWSIHTGFQRVRSTMQIFATTVFAHVQRAKEGGWVPALIGPGDLPLSNPDVVNALLTSGLLEDDRLVASFREIAGNEVVDTTDDRGTARQKDKASKAPYTSINPRVSERLGTALFLYSISPRPRGVQGATERELKAATFVPTPTYEPSDAEVIWTELADPVTGGFVTLDSTPGKGGQPGRHSFTTRQTINLLIATQRAMVSEADRDQVLADRAWSLHKSGPFDQTIRVETPPSADNQTLLEILTNAGIDDQRKTRLVFLDPRRFSLLNGSDTDTRSAVAAALGTGPDRLPVSWASSAIFVCVNTQRRQHARNLVSEYEARRRVADIDSVKADPDMKAKADAEVREATMKLDDAIKKAYQHILFLTETAAGARKVETHRLTSENQTALFGDVVWAALQAKDKVFGVGEFNTQALLHQLRDSDYGRPMSEIRDLWWNSPRLPLLHRGEPELRTAVYDAVAAGELALSNAAGQRYVASSESEINLGSSNIRLVKAVAVPQVIVPNVIGMTVTAATTSVVTAGLQIAVSGRGVATSQTPVAGAVVDEGSTVSLVASARGGGWGGQAPPATEYQVKLSAISSIQDNVERDALRLLLTQIANAVDDDASYIQINIHISVGEASTTSIRAAANSAGASATITEL